jgi:hypothetical protein
MKDIYNKQVKDEDQEEYTSDQEEDQDDDSPDNRYKVVCLKNNKECIDQPNCCQIELLPKLPTGIISIGRSGSGKTMATVTMLTKKYLLKDVFDYTYMYTGGIDPDEDLIKDLELSKENIFTDFKEQDIDDLMTKLQKSVKKNGMAKTPSVLMIFDDILGRPDFLKSKTLTKLVTANRHSNISYIIMSQYYKKLPPVARTNASYYMIFPSSASELEKIADELCPAGMNKKQFIKIAEHATKEQYSFLSINSKTKMSEQLRKNFDQILNLNE